MITCPACGGETRVLETRHIRRRNGNAVNELRRSRSCDTCATRFVTREAITKIFTATQPPTSDRKEP